MTWAKVKLGLDRAADDGILEGNWRVIAEAIGLNDVAEQQRADMRKAFFWGATVMHMCSTQIYNGPPEAAARMFGWMKHELETSHAKAVADCEAEIKAAAEFAAAKSEP